MNYCGTGATPRIYLSELKQGDVFIDPDGGYCMVTDEEGKQVALTGSQAGVIARWSGNERVEKVSKATFQHG